MKEITGSVPPLTIDDVHWRIVANSLLNIIETLIKPTKIFIFKTESIL